MSQESVMNLPLDEDGILQDAFSESRSDHEDLLPGIFCSSQNISTANCNVDDLDTSSKMQHNNFAVKGPMNIDNQHVLSDYESPNITDFEASKDDIHVYDDQPDCAHAIWTSSDNLKKLDTSEDSLEQSFNSNNSFELDCSNDQQYKLQCNENCSGDNENGEQCDDLRDLGVLMDDAGFSSDVSPSEFNHNEDSSSQMGVDFIEGECENLAHLYHLEYPNIVHQADMSANITNNAITSADGNSLDSCIVVFNDEIDYTKNMDYHSTQLSNGCEETLGNQQFPHSSIYVDELIDSRMMNEKELEKTGKTKFRGQNLHQKHQHTLCATNSKGEIASNTGRKGETSRPSSAASVALDTHQQRSMDSGSMSKSRSQERFFLNAELKMCNAEQVNDNILPESGSGCRSNRRSRMGMNSNVYIEGVSSKFTKKSNPVNNNVNGAQVKRASEEFYSGQTDGDLASQLLLESSKRKQATELVQQLQEEYDSLLSKYASAELAIDKMRLATTDHLNLESPTPQYLQSVHISPVTSNGRKGQLNQMHAFSKGNAVLGSIDLRCAPTDRNTAAHSILNPADHVLDHNDVNQQSGSNDIMCNKDVTALDNIEEQLELQAIMLASRLGDFLALCDQKKIGVKEQREIFGNMSSDHQQLRTSYLRAKDEHRNFSEADGQHIEFDSKHDLESKLFHLSMKFDIVQEKLETGSKATTFCSTQLLPLITQELKQTAFTKSSNSIQSLEDGRFEENCDFNMNKCNFHLNQSCIVSSEDAGISTPGISTPGISTPGMSTPGISTPESIAGATGQVIDKSKPHCLHREFNDLKLDKKLHHGSISSFPDSGLSDQEAKDVLYNEDRLAKLPGPGKMKQLTNHRCEIDVDSGFVGSVVSNLEGIQNPMQNRKRPSHTKQVERKGERSRPGSSRSSSIATSDQSSEVSSRSSSSSDKSQTASSVNCPSYLSPTENTNKSCEQSLDEDLPHGSYSVYSTNTSSSLHQQQCVDLLCVQQELLRGKCVSKQSYQTSSASECAGNPILLSRSEKGKGDNSCCTQTPGLSNHVSRTTHADIGNKDDGFCDVFSPCQSSNQKFTWKDQAETIVSMDHQSRDENQHLLNERPLTSLFVEESCVSFESDVRDEKANLQEAHVADTCTELSNQNSQRLMQHDKSLLHNFPDEEQECCSHGQPFPEEILDGHVRPSLQKADETHRQHSWDKLQDAHRNEFHEKKHDTSLMPCREKAQDAHAQPSREMEQDECHQQSSKDSFHRPKMEELHCMSICQSYDEVRDAKFQTSQERVVIHHDQEFQGNPLDDHSKPLVGNVREHDEGSSDKKQETSFAGLSHNMTQNVVDGHVQTLWDMQDGQIQPLSEELQDFHVQPNVSLHALQSSHLNNRDRCSTSSNGSSSVRLRMMQDEIEKLKISVFLAQYKTSERDECPTKAEKPSENRMPDYYDPFEDPYGFMNVPRRRANSFSGGNVRKYDEWYWTLPNKRCNDDDIPLGYAAADAYNHNYRKNASSASAITNRKTAGKLKDDARHGGKCRHENRLVDATGAAGDMVTVEADAKKQFYSTLLQHGKCAYSCQLAPMDREDCHFYASASCCSEESNGQYGRHTVTDSPPAPLHPSVPQNSEMVHSTTLRAFQNQACPKQPPQRRTIDNSRTVLPCCDGTMREIPVGFDEPGFKSHQFSECSICRHDVADVSNTLTIDHGCCSVHGHPLSSTHHAYLQSDNLQVQNNCDVYNNKSSGRSSLSYSGQPSCSAYGGQKTYNYKANDSDESDVEILPNRISPLRSRGRPSTRLTNDQQHSRNRVTGRISRQNARRIDIDLSASLKLSEDIGKMTKRMLDSVHDELRKNSLRKGGRHRFRISNRKSVI